RQGVNVIVTIGGDIPAHVAQRTTSTIPIVFATGSDALDLGLVTNLGRPEGNITGVSFYSTELAPKRLELLRDLLPNASSFAFIMGSAGTSTGDKKFSDEFMTAARSVGVKGIVRQAKTEQDIDDAFAAFTKAHVAALVVSNDAYLNSRREQIVSLAARHTMPAIYAYREHIHAGGLMSYGADVSEMYRSAGVYVGRILKGTKPLDLPVQIPTKFELLINLKTAKALGLTIPPTLLARADEVIE
ncbi:MAG TPA: ABC transporter substrate-binding protein, partial [Methyloceanibacter sp.]|nr:ABC transporter substrate-binding protein [Methyloceanibacter sp.]